ncbi:O-antigen ligase family protein [Anaeromyxobacter oryzae]|uniref:O-antigen ligase family protein n=1 Tax=Anaeromyxobacter oryzae TaxID=2918170 RepID=UPI0020C0377A|nr:O-antigen ligase family protein [Anaeromyxobacter oryzae]
MTNSQYAQFALLAAAALYALRALRGGTIRRPSSVEVLLVLFAGYAIASILWRDVSSGASATTIFVEYVGLAAAFIVVVRTSGIRSNWYFLATCYIVGCCVDLILIFSAFKSGTTIDSAGRYGLANVNSNYTAYSLVSGVPLLVLLYWRRARRRLASSIALMVGMSTFGLGIGLTGCRGATVAFLLCVFVIAARGLKTRPLAGGLFTASMAGVLVAGWSHVEDVLPSRLFLDASSAEDLSSGRFTLWERALVIFGRNPLLGSGADSYPWLSEDGMHAHNVFLSVLAELGIIGLLLLVVALALLFRSYFRSSASKSARSAALMLVCTWLVIAGTGVWQYALPAWIMFGLFVTIPRDDAEFTVADGELTARDRSLGWRLRNPTAS